jgi:hypothetical protein
MPDETGMQLARLFSELRGGHWALEDDRRGAAKVIAAWPRAEDAVRRYDKFRERVAEAAVRRGIASVIFGAGFPSGGHPHLAAAEANPDARFWYAEPAMIAGQRTLALGADKRAQAVAGGIRAPRGLLAKAGLLGVDGKWLGDGPCQVQWGLWALLMDGAECASVVAQWGRLLPAGSELVIPLPDGDGGAALTAVADAHPHTAADLRGWCGDAGLILDHPVADVRAHGRETVGRALKGGGGRIVAAVARVP